MVDINPFTKFSNSCSGPVTLSRKKSKEYLTERGVSAAKCSALARSHFGTGHPPGNSTVYVHSAPFIGISGYVGPCAVAARPSSDTVISVHFNVVS